MRVAVALSGGRGSAAMLCLAVAQGHDVVALHALHPYASPLAARNAQMAARRLDVPLMLLPLARRVLDRALDQGFGEMADGATPWASVCTRCSRLVHKALSRAACQLGADEVWVGVTDVQRRHMAIEPMAGDPPEVWPLADPMTEDNARRMMRMKGLGKGLRWSPLLTNCRVNWRIMRECVRAGRPNSYLGYFLAHTANRWKQRLWRAGFWLLNGVLWLDWRK